MSRMIQQTIDGSKVRVLVRGGNFVVEEIGGDASKPPIAKVIGCQGSWNDSGCGLGRCQVTRCVKAESGSKVYHLLSHQQKFPCPNPGCDEMQDIQREIEESLLSEGKISESELPVDDRTIFNHQIVQRNFKISSQTKAENTMEKVLMGQVLGHPRFANFKTEINASILTSITLALDDLYGEELCKRKGKTTGLLKNSTRLDLQTGPPNAPYESEKLMQCLKAMINMCFEFDTKRHMDNPLFQHHFQWQMAKPLSGLFSDPRISPNILKSRINQMEKKLKGKGLANFKVASFLLKVCSDLSQNPHLARHNWVPEVNCTITYSPISEELKGCFGAVKSLHGICDELKTELSAKKQISFATLEQNVIQKLKRAGRESGSLQILHQKDFKGLLVHKDFGLYVFNHPKYKSYRQEFNMATIESLMTKLTQEVEKAEGTEWKGRPMFGPRSRKAPELRGKPLKRYISMLKDTREQLNSFKSTANCKDPGFHLQDAKGH